MIGECALCGHRKELGMGDTGGCGETVDLRAKTIKNRGEKKHGKSEEKYIRIN